MINHIISKLSSNTHLKELVKGSSIAFIFRILGMCFGYIFIFLIARWYGSEAVGSFSLSFTLLHIFTTIGVFGFDNSLIKFISDFNSNNKLDLVKEIYKKSLYITIPLGIILSVFLYYSANFFALVVFKNENLELFFQIAALAIPALIILRINATVFRGLKKIKLFSILRRNII